jgi:hypothetical protein
MGFMRRIICWGESVVVAGHPELMAMNFMDDSLDSKSQAE